MTAKINGALKPCPFCGGLDFKLEAMHTFTEDCIVLETYPHISFKKQKSILKLSCACGCSFEKEVYFTEDFIDQWNRRNDSKIF